MSLYLSIYPPVLYIFPPLALSISIQCIKTNQQINLTRIPSPNDFLASDILLAMIFP